MSRPAGNQTYDEFLNSLKDVMVGCMEVLKNERWMVFNVGTVVSKSGMKFLSGDIVRIAEECGFIFRKDVIWHKPRGQTKWQRGATQFSTNPFPRHFNTNINHEFILLFTKGEVKRRGASEAKELNPSEYGDFVEFERAYVRKVAYSVWDITPVNSPINDEKHAAPFPEELPQRIIELFTYPNETVLDPFSGAGTTLRMAKKLNRKFIGIEMSEKYVSNSVKRINETKELPKDKVVEDTALRFSLTDEQKIEKIDKKIKNLEKKQRDIYNEGEIPKDVVLKGLQKRIKRLENQEKKLIEANAKSAHSLEKFDMSSGKP
jgi:site-specific DNA-methyltransferase (adenine-specific)